jgi:SAM-dependent methyltransferase
MRFRAIMAAFQTELDNTHQIQVLERLPKRKSIKGIGMSDANVYAAGLRRKFDYLNTFFHTQPRLDIRSPDPHYIGQYDFVVSSDVMEHVDGPCERALGNLRMLLKPGGLLALTVPYPFEGGTVEHFPELHDYRIEGKGTDRVLVNVTRDGREQRFSDLCFHGGDGSTLELRIYAFNDLMRLLGEVGFTDIKLHDTDHPQWGIIHRHRLGAPVTARAG